MDLLRDIENLKSELYKEYLRYGNFSHPVLVALSKRLDEKIYAFMKYEEQSNTRHRNHKQQK